MVFGDFEWHRVCTLQITPCPILFNAAAGYRRRNNYTGYLGDSVLGTGTGRFDGMFAAVEKVLNPTSVKNPKPGFPVTSLILEMDGAKLN